MGQTRSTCCYCGVGCGVLIESDGARITGVAGDPDHPANFGRLCTKGATLHLADACGARAQYPELRRARSVPRVRVGRDVALDHAAARFAATIRAHGPDRVAFYISGQLLTEDYCAHVLKPCLQTRKRNYLYIVTEFVDGQTLTQWMIDNPKPELEAVRGIIEQMAKGLQAFHRMEMLHQDLRPANVMIDGTGTVKIIDFGSTCVAGVMEIAAPEARTHLLGTAQYTAPEYFLGEAGSTRSDNFSLGVIGYQMLTGKLPYGAEVAKSRTKAAQGKLRYQSLLEDGREIPAWIDAVLRKAVQPDPYNRYEELSEFIYDLRHPNKVLLNEKSPPLIDRNPLVFWKCVSFILTIIIALLLYR